MLWFSSGGTKSVLHNDYAENIMCVFRGNKEFFLVDKEYQELVKSISFKYDKVYGVHQLYEGLFRRKTKFFWESKNFARNCDWETWEFWGDMKCFGRSEILFRIVPKNSRQSIPDFGRT